jgi:predicted patatin/cPLA2 family phospholipase
MTVPVPINKEKTAMILIGGGMRSAYSAGFLSALANNPSITKPDIMIGSSADSGNVLYFCAGQYTSFKRVWTDLVSTPKFISVRRPFKIMDVDYLIDTVFKKQEPLIISNVLSSKIEWFIPVTDVDHGEVRYVSRNDSLELFEVLRAAKAIPILYNKKIPLASSTLTSRYIDGEFGATLNTHIECAINAGATRIFILKNNPAWKRYRKIIIKLYLITLPRCTRLLIKRDLESSASLESVAGLYSNVTIQMHAPDIQATPASHSAKLLKEVFDQGERDVLAMEPELRKLFNIQT